MAFLLKTSDIPATPPAEYLPATAEETYIVGEALKLNSGTLTKAGATDIPTFICAGQPGEQGVPVYRVQKTQTYDTTHSAAGTSLKIGDKVTLHTDGLQVTATTTSGVAEIVSLDGTAVGDTVTVRFPDVMTVKSGA